VRLGDVGLLVMLVKCEARVVVEINTASVVVAWRKVLRVGISQGRW
jgi:hypothetical protein